ANFGGWLALNEPAIWKEIILMAAGQGQQVAPDFRVLVEYLKQTGDVKRFIETMGVKEAVDALGVEQIWAGLSAQTREARTRLPCRPRLACVAGPGPPGAR